MGKNSDISLIRRKYFLYIFRPPIHSLHYSSKIKDSFKEAHFVASLGKQIVCYCQTIANNFPNLQVSLWFQFELLLSNYYLFTCHARPIVCVSLSFRLITEIEIIILVISYFEKVSTQMQMYDSKVTKSI